jgi:Asp-tRNA(Asn)/Glu-tRNA(Gln) amidotransferase C subunit
MSKLTRAEVEKVAALARLGLTSEETIVQVMPLRDDTPSPSLSVDAALQNAPARSGDFVRVQAILSEEADG